MYEVKTISKSEGLTERQERIAYESADAKAISKLTDDATLIIEPVGYCYYNVLTNEHDFNKLVILTSTGDLYTTSSESLTEMFTKLYDEYATVGQPIGVKFYKKVSKKNSSRKYIACSLAY